MERRKFIKTTGSVGIFSLLGGASWILNSCKKGMMDMNMNMSAISVIEGSFSIDLVIPQSLNAKDGISLDAKSNTSYIINGKISRVYGYSGSILGPIIKAENGDAVSINVKNSLEEDTNIHWHGLLVPPSMDGHPENVIQQGSSFNYQFTINQRAGTYWFHPHPHLKTGKQVNKGLAGFFIINDAEEKLLNLPAGELEIPLVIQDKRIYADGAINYSPTMDDYMSGYMGQYVCVNGIWSPNVKVKTRIYRLRILNGSNARVYNLSFSNNQNFTIIGSDAGLLTTAQTVSSILFSPGERIDILVDFSNVAVGSEIYLQSNTFNGGDSQGTQSFKMMKFTIASQESESYTIPTILSSIIPISSGNSSKTRTFDISNPHDMTSGSGGHGGHNASTSNMGNLHNIGGKSFDMQRIDETVSAGTTEVWEFDNSNGMDLHPMHIHGVHFQVLERLGGRNTVQAHETGWKDTVLCMPGEKVKVIITFPNNPGKFVFHCHNLEHEDSGMMLNFKIV